MIGLMIFIEIVILVLTGVFFYLIVESWEHEFIFAGLAVICFLALFILPIGIGELHGYIDYKPSNDKDLARITAVTQEQTAFRTYYKIEVEYLTNTPTQEGMIQNRNIEKDTFYCYYEDEALVKKLKENMYKELWIISGYKGGYDTYKDFETKLIKDIELKEE